MTHNNPERSLAGRMLILFKDMGIVCNDALSFYGEVRTSSDSSQTGFVSCIQRAGGIGVEFIATKPNRLKQLRGKLTSSDFGFTPAQAGTIINQIRPS